jgi:hypothetical protein
MLNYVGIVYCLVSCFSSGKTIKCNKLLQLTSEVFASPIVIGFLNIIQRHTRYTSKVSITHILLDQISMVYA